ncbi:type II secretion system F family protein [Neptunomonas japonica]|uniref:type II secretion system F family protein n=1 Tax=Neptunomonas japonica TaxID=417574 RepID=UPI00040D7118|nr:type II secretion system F family protein [Neptunomonas japonica]
MHTYRYSAMDHQGRKLSGQLTAPGLTEARSQLRNKALYILDISLAPNFLNPFSILGALFRKLSPKQYRSASAADKVILFRQLALMLRSGNTLTQGLEVCAEMTEKLTLSRSLLDVLIRIRSGSSFAAAMDAQGRNFPPVVSKLIASAEVSGELQATLERLADNLERGAAVRRQLISSLAYPIVLFLAAFGVFMGLALGIVPKFAKMLEGKSQDLPAITQAMLDVSAWMIDYGAYLGGSLLGGILAILIAYTTRPGKAVIDRILLRVPIIGSSIRTSGMAQLGWTMSMLLSSGLTVLESLRVMSSITGNLRLAKCFDKAGSDILSGRSLAYGFQQSNIPVMVQHMTGIGERSGELEHVMHEIGKYYQHNAEIRIKAMIAMIEPAMTLVVGGMVAFVYIGFFKAMMQVSAG